MTTVILARHAMSTRFELVLHGGDEAALRAAGEEALDEITRLEDELSYFRATSQIFRLNREAARQPVRVTPWLLRLLQQAQRLSAESGGTFDITVAPLMRCWGFYTREGRVPEAEALAQARAGVGMHLVELNAPESTVRFTHSGVQLDLGSIGKGYAVERAGELLREAGVTSALLHGGTSTVLAIGTPPNAEGWKIAIDHPGNPHNSPEHTGDLQLPLATVRLRDESLSVSAVWGKSFTAADKSYGHVIDPRTGQPTEGALLAAIVLPSATEGDALSTMLLTLGAGEFERVLHLREGMRALVAGTGTEGKALRIESHGFELRHAE
ncbi:MAG: FAD:protein FMN transferase [Verrucomicrobia bacterium]|nr:FAD:protein FMN transferase [Verrucomicrobiota bacterium]